MTLTTETLSPTVENLWKRDPSPSARASPSEKFATSEKSSLRAGVRWST